MALLLDFTGVNKKEGIMPHGLDLSVCPGFYDVKSRKGYLMNPPDLEGVLARH